MNFKQLNHLIVLAEEGRFVTAAERVHLSQAALSRSIQTLEQQVGLRLFDRGPQGARLTPAGQVFVERARRLVFDARCITRDLDLMRQGELGPLTFGAGPVPSTLIVPPLLVAMHSRRPGLVTHVRSGNHSSLLELLDTERIDFFMADARLIAPDERLKMVSLARLHGGLYCHPGHALSGQARIDQAALERYGMASVSTTPLLRQHLASALGFGSAAALPMRIECDDLGTLHRIACESEMLVLLPHAMANAGGSPLCRLAMGDMPLPLFVDLHAVWLRGRTLAPVAELAMDCARAVASELSA